MKRINYCLAALLCLFVGNSIFAQDQNKCSYCTMHVEDASHLARVQSKSGNELHFDAIECMVNYIKQKEEGDFSSIQVADYQSEKLIDAKSAFYLKSKAIPSPMGAFLSAFTTKAAAEAVKDQKGGEIFNWETLKKRFANSRYGAIEPSHHNHNRPDAYAPSGIMGDHLHAKGGLMVSFRYMNMAMDGNISGSESVSNETVYNSYMVAPQEMDMQMYMLGIMYAPSDKLTLMMMQNYVSKDMDLTARMMRWMVVW